MRVLLLTLLAGALGGLARRHSLRGVIPGAVLAGALVDAVGGDLLRGEFHLDAVTGLSILIIGFSQSIFVGEPNRRFIDIPLDYRLAMVVSAGLFLRGAALLVRALIAP